MSKYDFDKIELHAIWKNNKTNGKKKPQKNPTDLFKIVQL